MGISNLYTNQDNLSASANVLSPWFDVSKVEFLTVIARADGVYQLQIDWSHDGSTIAFTETPTVSLNARNPPIDVLGPFCRFRIRNTGVTPFTSHITCICEGP